MWIYCSYKNYTANKTKKKKKKRKKKKKNKDSQQTTANQEQTINYRYSK